MGILALVLALQAAGQVYNQPTGGDRVVCMEAESFASEVVAGGKDWTLLHATTVPTADAGFLGTGAMAAMPNTGGPGNDSIAAYVNNSALHFRILFRATGTHYLWLRGRSRVDTGQPEGNNDSCHIALNGTGIATGFQVQDFDELGWKWSRARNGGNISFDVPSLGVHTLSVYVREDGFMVDRLFVTTNANYTAGSMAQDATVDGPAVTATTADLTPPQPAAPTLTPGSFSIRVTWSAVANADTYILQRSDNGGAFNTIFTGNALTYNDDNLFDQNIDRCYRVAGSDTVFGPGLFSNSSCARSQLPPPRTQDNEEGLIDENCACGARAEGGPVAAWILLPLLLLFRRR